MYGDVGYKVILASFKDNTGTDEMRSILQDKITLVSGHSGVGKSSFINNIIPALALKTQHVSGWSGKKAFTPLHSLKCLSCLLAEG